MEPRPRAQPRRTACHSLYRSHPSDDRDELIESATRLGLGEDLRFTNRVRHSDRSYRYLSWSAPPSPVARVYFVVARDVTTQIEADHERAEAVAILHGMFYNSPVAQARQDLSGHFLEVNEALCELTGYSRAELLETDFQSMTHPDDLTGNVDLWEQLLNGQIPNYSYEKRYRLKAGGYRRVPATSVVLLATDLRPSYCLMTVQDLTERESANQARAESEAKSRFLASKSRVENAAEFDPRLQRNDA